MVARPGGYRCPRSGATDALWRVPQRHAGPVCEAQSRLLESVDHTASARPGAGKYCLSDASDADVRQLSTAAAPRMGAKSYESGPTTTALPGARSQSRGDRFW